MDYAVSDFSMDFFRLDGKVAIVTGGYTGLGQGYSVALAKAGADLFIVTHSSEQEETRKLIEAEGRQDSMIFQSIVSVNVLRQAEGDSP